MTFIENAKKLKKEKSYTTNELSKICGIPLGTLSKLFSGTIEEPKLSAAVAIAKALDTSIDALCELNNDSYTSEEIDLLNKYRKLDRHGKNFASLIISNELDRISSSTHDSSINSVTKDTDDQADKFAEAAKKAQKNEPVKTTVAPTPQQFSIISLPLYNTPVSAGIGEFLDDNNTSVIRVKNTEKVAQASYALRVSGDSMMPEYNDGDILIIKEQNTVTNGELGIFVCDGQGYFKKFAGDRLVSLNPEYDDMMLSSFSSSSCVGLVLGRLKAKKS